MSWLHTFYDLSNNSDNDKESYTIWFRRKFYKHNSGSTAFYVDTILSSYYFRIFNLKAWQCKTDNYWKCNLFYRFLQSVIIPFIRVLSITINLIIIAIGISFTEVGAFNISTLFVPKQFSGISIGITTLLFLVGMSIGPAISGMFMEQYRVIINAVVGSYPSGEAYDLIFLTGALISIVAVALTLVVTRRVSISSSIFVER